MSSRTPLNPLGLSGGGGTAGAMSGIDARSDPLAAAEGLLGKYATARPATAMRPGTAMGARPGTAARARPGSARGGRPPVSPRSPRAEIMTLDTSSVAEDSHNLDESAEISYGDGFETDDRSDADASRSVEADAAAMDDSDDAAFYDNDDGGGAEVTTFSDGAEGIVLDDDSLGDSVSIDFDASARSPATPATRPKSAPRRDVDLSMSVDDDALGDASISVDADDFATAASASASRAPPAANRPASAKGRPRGAPPPPPPREPLAAAPWAGALSDGEDDDVDDDVDGDVDGDVDDDVEMVDESGFSFSPSPRSPAAVEAEDETEALHRRLAGNDPMTQLRAFERDEGLSPSAGGPSPRSPAATEAANETEALHRMLAGNDPVSSLRSQFSPQEETTEASGGRRRRPTSPPRAMPRAIDPDESAEEVADESAAALEILDESAEEIATEPRTSRGYSEHLADYSETFESPDASRAIEGADDASAPRDADGSRLDGPKLDGSKRDGSSDIGDKVRALLEDLRALRSGDVGAGGPASAKDVAELSRLLREVRRATRRRGIGVSRRAAAYPAYANVEPPAKKDYLGAFANLRRRTTEIERQTTEDGPLQKSYATTREEWSAYLAGEGGYPAGAPRPLGLDHDEKSFREIWNAARLREKLTTNDTANDTAEDTSTSRAIAAAIQAHGVCGNLRARVASIQMRLRSAAHKRELERARAFG